MKIALIDSNNLSYKIYSQFVESRGGLLRNTFGVPTTVIFGLLRTFNLLANKTSFDHIIACWDTSGSYYRREIFPLYKKHRKYKDMKDYFTELDSARNYLDKFGINQITLKGIEADDLIGYLAHSLKEKGHKVIIISDDRDFYQVVSQGIKIFRPIKNEFVNESEVREEYEMAPKYLPRIKAITGEKTDFIPGVCGINEKDMKLISSGLGEKTAMKILKNRINLKEAIEKCPLEKWKDLLIEKKKQIHLSYKLARIRTKFKYYLPWEQELLKEMTEKALERKSIKLKTVIRLKNDLDIKVLNIPYILKRLGINVIGNVMDESKRITV